MVPKDTVQLQEKLQISYSQNSVQNILTNLGFENNSQLKR